MTEERCVLKMKTVHLNTNTHYNHCFYLLKGGKLKGQWSYAVLEIARDNWISITLQLHSSKPPTVICWGTPAPTIIKGLKSYCCGHTCNRYCNLRYTPWVWLLYYSYTNTFGLVTTLYPQSCMSFCRECLGPIVGGALAYKVGFRSMAAVRTGY